MIKIAAETAVTPMESVNKWARINAAAARAVNTGGKNMQMIASAAVTTGVDAAFINPILELIK